MGQTGESRRIFRRGLVFDEGRLYNMEDTKCIANDILMWYSANARVLPWRADRDPYHVWLSEIMLQQTRVEAVKAYYKRFLDTLPNIKALAEAEEEVLLKLWEGLGYYNRVRNMQKAARTIQEEYGGKFPTAYEQIRSLSGIGDYTAGAIGSICFNLPTPAVDGNVLRVWSRLTMDSASIDKASTKKRVQEELRQLYEAVPKQCGTLTQGLMELGATVCIPNGSPDCARCPIQKYCKAAARGCQMDYPVRDAKKARKVEDKTVLLLQCGEAYALRKRGKGGLLAGLWEFPNVPGHLSSQEAADCATQWAVAPKHIKMQVEYKHIFSHVEWHLLVYYIGCTCKTDDFSWASIEELASDKAIPSAFKPCVNIILSDE